MTTHPHPETAHLSPLEAQLRTMVIKPLSREQIQEIRFHGKYGTNANTPMAVRHGLVAFKSYGILTVFLAAMGAMLLDSVELFKAVALSGAFLFVALYVAIRTYYPQFRLMSTWMTAPYATYRDLASTTNSPYPAIPKQVHDTVWKVICNHSPTAAFYVHYVGTDPYVELVDDKTGERAFLIAWDGDTIITGE